MKSRSILALSLVIALVAAGVMLIDSPVTATEEAALRASDDGDAASEETAQPEIKGSDKKGKYWFKKSCKSCHGKDGDGGELTPISKTIKQWERYFKKGEHQGEEMLDKAFDAEQLIHIRTFLINHAADSDQPETCG